MSKIEVDTIDTVTGTTTLQVGSTNTSTINIGASGDTINIPSGATFNVNGASFKNGITMADQWRLTANTNTSTDADVTTNWERVDNFGWGSIGTGLTESSGIFSFPSTGIYLINYTAVMMSAANDTTTTLNLDFTEDNSTYVTAAQVRNGAVTSGTAGTGASTFLFDITDITNNKIKFRTSSFDSGSYLQGNTTSNYTNFSAFRIGDT